MSGPTGGASGYAQRTIPNIRAVARREFMWRLRTRTFKFTTVLLVVAGVGLALLPTIFALIDREGTGDRGEVVVGDAAPSVDVVTALNTILNTADVSPIPIDSKNDAAPRFNVVASGDLAASRAHVVDGSSVAALALGRSAEGDLTFELYSKDGAIARRTQLIRQAAISITIQDRLTRAGIPPIDQARLFNPPEFEVLPADPNAKPGPESSIEAASAFFVAFGLSVTLFMAIILYGQWIAFSVAEEKNSRVMEVVLAAATPFQLLAGKVIGVGALGLAQFLLVAVATGAAIIFQGQIASIILGGDPGSISLPEGLSLGLLGVFLVMFVLGFGLYATLYAGAAALVSRQEDINQIVAPLTLVSVAGYLVATYAGTGLIPIDSPLVIVMSYIPLFSPYLMMTRFGIGAAGPLEVLVAIVLLALTVPVALWIAARLYRSGVLMYGQAPTPRTLVRALLAR
ncbi:MAG: ABC transporter permease [Chloroflexi bacterium]|nr:ABC transporter permease [Chloroflexota bacterium]